jgi:probable rRNA maturation factor
VIHVLVRCGHPRGKGAAARLRRRAREFLQSLGRDGSELSLSLVGDGEIRDLNRSWRGKDAATDVLSFPLAEPSSGLMLGDVVISFDTAERVARDDGREVADELDRYLAHGILHLLGHDHERPRAAREMAALEERLLSADGLVGAALGPERTVRRPRSPRRRTSSAPGSRRRAR